MLGVRNGKFPLADVAAAVTCVGRSMILQTKAYVESQGHTVIYGDTDSVMVRLPLAPMSVSWTTLRQLGDHISNVVFGEFDSIVMNPEKVYTIFMIQEAKKRYMGIYNEGGRKDKNTNEYVLAQEMKGVQPTRRDVFPFLKELWLQALALMMPRTGDARVQVTGPLLRSMLVRELGRVIRDEVDVWKYCRCMTAKTNYAGTLPEHMHVFHRFNERVRRGEMAAVGDANKELNTADGGERAVNFDMMHSGARVSFLVWFDPAAVKEKKKLSDHVEDPEWVLYHNRSTPDAKKHILVDRLYYIQQCAPSITTLLSHHVPDAIQVFETAAVAVRTQMSGAVSMSLRQYFAPTVSAAGSADCTNSASGDGPSRDAASGLVDDRGVSSALPCVVSSAAVGALSPDAWARSSGRHAIVHMKQIVQTTRLKHRNVAKGAQVKAAKENPSKHSIARFFTEKKP